jgi:hypothetical protein
VILQLLKSRTVWFAIIVAVLSVLQGFVFLLPINPLYQMFTGVAISVGIVIFRMITAEPLSSK